MQTSPLTPALIPTSGATDNDLPGRAARDVQKQPLGTRTAPSAAVKAEQTGGAAETVSISAGVQALQANGMHDAPAPVYAEVWKGGVMVARIDVHGHVISSSGLVPSGDGGFGGALLAAQRTVQVAQMTGGEIRAAGQMIDGKTLLMRARLANTYAV